MLSVFGRLPVISLLRMLWLRGRLLPAGDELAGHLASGPDEKRLVEPAAPRSAEQFGPLVVVRDAAREPERHACLCEGVRHLGLCVLQLLGVGDREHVNGETPAAALPGRL